MMRSITACLLTLALTVGQADIAWAQRPLTELLGAPASPVAYQQDTNGGEAYGEMPGDADLGVEPPGTMASEDGAYEGGTYDQNYDPSFDDCDAGCARGHCNCQACNPYYVRGWLSQGYTFNPDYPDNNFNTPQTFNDRANEYQMNQLYLTMGKQVDSSTCQWDLGGRVDLLYGTDYFFVESRGLERNPDNTPRWNSPNGPRGAGAALYGLAMPQLYAELYAPIGNGVTFKLGHFYTIMGYESPMATENFFYSTSYTKQYGEPFTHTGALASFAITPCLSFQGGIHRGWNTWEGEDDTISFLGGFFWHSRDNRSTASFVLNTGQEPAGATRNQRTNYSLIGTHQLTKYWRYVIQHDLGVETDGSATGDAEWYSINQYMFLALTPHLDFGVRYEWFRDDDNARVLAIPLPAVTGGNYHSATAGFNFSPRPNIRFRPEARWDWSDVESPGLGIGGMFNEFSQKHQFTLGADLIVTW